MRGPAFGAARRRGAGRRSLAASRTQHDAGDDADDDAGQQDRDDELGSGRRSAAPAAAL